LKAGEDRVVEGLHPLCATQYIFHYQDFAGSAWNSCGLCVEFFAAIAWNKIKIAFFTVWQA
jgi:hypothetical protein